MPADYALYAFVVGLTAFLSGLYWRTFKVPAGFIVRCLALTLLIVLPLTMLGVAVGILPVTIALVVLSEEWARWLIVKSRPPTIRRRHVAVSVGLLFGLIETTNWLFVDKARVALADSGLEPGAYIYADAAYIFAEFAAGVVVHGGLTALLFAVQGRNDNRERLALGAALATLLHFVLNIIIFSGFRA